MDFGKLNESLYAAMDPVERKLFLANYPPEQIATEYERRGLGPQNIGEAAVRGAAAELAEWDSDTLQQKLAEMIDPNHHPTAADQLEVLEQFWRKLGKELPKLDAEQRVRFEAAVEGNPQMHAIAVPVTGLNGWRVMANRAAEQYPDLFAAENPLVVPDAFASNTTISYGSLLRSVNEAVELNGKTYQLLYKMPDSNAYGSRDALNAALRKAGVVVQGSGNENWAFAMAKPIPITSSNREAYWQLSHLNALALPEMVIAGFIMEQIAGRQPTSISVIANQAGFLESETQLSDEGASSITVVTWNRHNKSISVDGMLNPHARYSTSAPFHVENAL